MSKIIKSNNNRNIGFYLDDKNSDLILSTPKFLRDKISEFKFSNNEIEYEFFKFYELLQTYKEKSYQKSIKERDFFRNPSNLKLNENIQYSLIELYFTLLDDYKRNGILMFKKLNTNLKRKGRINWSESINKRCEMVFGDSVIFNKFFYNNLIFDYNNILTILYCTELLKASKILDYKIYIPYTESSLRKFTDLELDKLTILNTLKHIIFSDREIKIFNILYCIFDLEHKLKSNYLPSGSLLYAEKFDNIWEEMLRVSLFSTPNKYNEFLLTGSYFLFNQIVNTAKYHPRLDIVVEESFDDENYLIILDAKNYIALDSNEIDSLPGTESLTKQYLYKYFLTTEQGLKKFYQKEKIINAFLFPAVLKENLIEYIGYYKFRESLDVYEDILCFHVDFFKLRDAYLDPDLHYKAEFLSYIIKTFLSLK